MTTGCVPLSVSDPGYYVNQGWGVFQKYASDGYALASNQITRLNNFTNDFHVWDGSFAPVGAITPFVRPERPDYPTIAAPDMSGDVPDAPTLAITPLVLETAPAEPASLLTPPVILEPTRPSALTITAPGAAPKVAVLDMPNAPALNDIALPTFIDVVLPEEPEILVSTFDESVPEFTAVAPSETLEFVEDTYVSTLMGTIKSRIQHWIDTDGRVPEALTTYLWDRAVSRDDASAAKLTQEVREEFGSRGFDEPPGMMAGRLLEVRQINRNKRNELTRDRYIQDETIAIENLKFAVQQGISLEATLLQAHLTIEQRRFELTRAVKDVALAVFNARVTQHNGAIAAYNARIDAYKAFLEGLRAKVDVYRAMVEAAKTRGEINEQRVRMFGEQIRGEATRAETFRAQIEGFKARIDADRAAIEGYRAEVEAYESRVRAHGVEWDGYRSQVQAETERGRLYGSMVEAYGNRVRVWQTKGQMQVEQQRSELAQAQAFLQQHEGKVRVVLARLEAARTIVQAQSAQADSAARIYAADAQVEVAASDASTRSFQAETERAREATLAALRDAELQIAQLDKRANLLLRAMESGAQASSQLSASAFSAVNLSANISSSATVSSGCSTSYNFSGELAT